MTPATHSTWLSVTAAMLLSACSSPPKPPTVDEASRRPANTRMAIDLQTCRSDLANTRIRADESDRLAESAAIDLATAKAQLMAREHALSAERARPAPPPKPNHVFTVRFDFGSTQVAIPAEAAMPLIEQARQAPLVLLRGRTDGKAESAAESHVARGRAAAVRDYLVAAGVDPARIRATYQPIGDHVADNIDPTGQGLNRRVEVEVYRVLPVAPVGSPVFRP